MCTELIVFPALINGIVTPAITAAAMASRIATLRPSRRRRFRVAWAKMSAFGLGGDGAEFVGSEVGGAAGPGWALTSPRCDLAADEAWSLLLLGRAYLSLSPLPRPSTAADLTPGKEPRRTRVKGFQLPGGDMASLLDQEMNEFAFTALSRRLKVIGIGLPALAG
jgi:hypothetical protein